jgi:2-dehydro-3-deoxyphosphooctonate aldolase (KDO 8-P synthase)
MNIQKNIKLNGVNISNDSSLILILGPCQLESLSHSIMIIETILNICEKHKLKFIFKSSFDKANRTSHNSTRGIGLDQGLKIFQELKEQFDIPILTDVHHPAQCELVAPHVDIIQIPAFLCRQTDLILAAGETNKIVNIKKGQFLSANEMLQVAKKFESTGNNQVILTERGTSFGYNDLICDMRSLETLKKNGFPVILDATHSIQKPGGQGSKSGGEREFIEPLARAGTSLGIAGLFLETHEEPERAPSDGESMLHLENLEPLLAKVVAIDKTVKSFQQ